MTDTLLPLAADFSRADYAQWRALVDKALKGAPFEKKLVTRTYEGLEIQPIYAAADAPGDLPHALLGRAGNWQIRQIVEHPDPAVCNSAIRDELSHGVDAIWLALDPDGATGGLVRTLDDLDRTLDGVDLSAVPLALRPGSHFAAYGALLFGLFARRGIDPQLGRPSLGADPLGVLAATGTLPRGLDAAMGQMADLAVYVADEAPSARVLRLDMAPYHDAGADEAQVLACLLATAAAYLRELETREGMPPDRALPLFEAALPVDGDLFIGIAKLRAARLLWGRLAEACGVAAPQAPMRLHAVTARRVLTRRDPWVNLLRASATTFAAALGGADAITALPMDALLGLSTPFSRRVARNIQLVLREESHLGHVTDPAGGAWYLERLTADLATGAWDRFQDIERRGGMAAVLADGSLRDTVAATLKARKKALARRKDPLTGVSEFPDIHERPVAADQVDRDALRAAASAGSGEFPDPVEPGGGALTAGLTIAAGMAASLPALTDALGGEPTTVEALPAHHLSEDFEALREASDAFRDRTGQRPRIFLANLGRVAQHTARATFSKNYFEAGGIEAVSNSGFTDPQQMAAAFTESGATIAILCGSDDQYAEQVTAFAPALKAAGCKLLFLAGRPGDREDADRAAGVDRFIALGDDLLATLTETLRDLGVLPS